METNINRTSFPEYRLKCTPFASLHTLFLGKKLHVLAFVGLYAILKKSQVSMDNRSLRANLTNLYPL